MLLAVAVLLVAGPADAAIFAPMCDPSGATVPVAAPEREADSGALEIWLCGAQLLGAGNDTSRASPTPTESDTSLSLVPWGVASIPRVLPPYPGPLRTPVGEMASKALPRG